MNRLKTLFEKKNILSIYFTAGYPAINDTTTIIKELEYAGADAIEIGIPFSDPLADGPIIQQSSKIALDNGMTLSKLFSQISNIRESVKIPLILMGYFNPILQFGVENFCLQCEKCGIDGIIIPDLPVDEFQKHYAQLFKEHNLSNILLITPATSDKRLMMIDKYSDSFIYCVSSNSTTGTNANLNSDNHAYFNKLKKLQHPVLIGFGINDKTSFDNVCNYASGAIIGSAFIKALQSKHSLKESIHTFVQSIKPKTTSL